MLAAILCLVTLVGVCCLVVTLFLDDADEAFEDEMDALDDDQ